MKKIVGLLISALMLAAILTVFALPASAAFTNLGQWVSFYSWRYVTKDSNSYGYLVAKNQDTYTVAVYKYNGETVSSPTTETAMMGDFTTMSANSVPEAVRKKAKEDYPDITPVGSVISNGNIWIIVAVAAVAACIAVTLIIVKKKKKPAVADGVEIKSDKESEKNEK